MFSHAAALRQFEAPARTRQRGERRSHNGTYPAKVIAASSIAVGATQSWLVRVAAPRQGGAHAMLHVTAWMPDSGDVAHTVFWHVPDTRHSA